MIYPIEIQNNIENEASKNYSFSSLLKISQQISKNYLEHTKINDTYVSTKEEVLVYALMRMPATFSSVSFALEKSLPLIDNDINSIIDIGTGTGSSILAIKTLISPKIPLICIEKEPEMINFCKRYIPCDGVDFINETIVDTNIQTKGDLLIASYVLNELNDAEQTIVIHKIIEVSNKYILIVEPGTPESYKNMMKFRDIFIANGLKVVAPCTHQNKCPLSNDDWCNFSTRINRSKLHKQLKGGDAPFEDEKFIYLFLTKGDVKDVENRIIRHPIINKGNVSFTTCNKHCSIKQYLFTKKDRLQYKLVKKLKAGDLL